MVTPKFTLTPKQTAIVEDAKNGNANVDKYDGRSLRHLKERGIVKNTAGGGLALTKAASNAEFVTKGTSTAGV